MSRRTLSLLLSACLQVPLRGRGRFLQHVNEVVQHLQEDGVIDGRQRAAIVRAAPRSDGGGSAGRARR